MAFSIPSSKLWYRPDELSPGLPNNECAELLSLCNWWTTFVSPSFKKNSTTHTALSLRGPAWMCRGFLNVPDEWPFYNHISSTTLNRLTELCLLADDLPTRSTWTNVHRLPKCHWWTAFSGPPFQYNATYSQLSLPEGLSNECADHSLP